MGSFYANLRIVEGTSPHHGTLVACWRDNDIHDQLRDQHHHLHISIPLS